VQGGLAAAVFGRDEDDSAMELRQRDVDEQIVCLAPFLTDATWPLNELVKWDAFSICRAFRLANPESITTV